MCIDDHGYQHSVICYSVACWPMNSTTLVILFMILSSEMTPVVMYLVDGELLYCLTVYFSTDMLFSRSVNNFQLTV